MASDPEIRLTFDDERESGTNSLLIHDSFRRERATAVRIDQIEPQDLTWR